MANNLKFTGVITRVDEIESGISNSGNAWQKRIFRVDEEDGDYPSTVYFTLFGKKVDEINVTNLVGKEVEVHFNLRGREWTGQDGATRASNEVTAWKVAEI